MIYLPLSLVKEGMYLARDVYADPTALPLVVKGQHLTPAILGKLKSLNIGGIYVESKLADDVEVQELIEPALKKEMVVELKHLCHDYIHHAPITNSTLNSMSTMIETLLDNILKQENCLMNIIEIKSYDTYTYSHSIYVGTLAALIGIQQNYARSELSSLTMAGLLHDAGKLDVPLEIINKKGPLTVDEREVMKRHPRNAIQRLCDDHYMPQIVLRGIESHHEKYDGTGYPFGLAGEEIPEPGRILALADVYDALTSERSYRPGWPPNEAVEYMLGCSGSHFDPKLLKTFFHTIAAFPDGSIVKLSNDEIAVVIKNSSANVLRPVIRILTPGESQGREVNLFADTDYLNVTILHTVKDPADLPDNVF